MFAQATASASSSSIETAAIEALKQAPGLVICLVIVVMFLRYLTEGRKAEMEERKETRETLDKFASTQQQLAISVAELKETIRHVKT